jgi:hypothetical protein
MNSTLRNILAVLAGFLAGSAVNMGLIMTNGMLIPLPPGVDLSTPEGLNAAMPLFEPQHFLTPFLAHALGTLVGAAVAASIAVGRRIIPAMVIGACFFAGGIGAVMMIPAPMWFDIADLAMAYFPMAYFGYKLALRIKPQAA